MPKIAIHLDHPLVDGEQVTFKAPCASADATGLKIYTPTSYENETEISAVYTMKDAAKETMQSKTGIFASGAYVTVTLDTTNAIAYVQNASASQIEADITALDTGKAPKSHASSATTYGVGDASNYGHVKLANNLTTASGTTGTALNAYQGKVLNDSKAPNDHSSTATTYGVATNGKFGHVQIVDNFNETSFDSTRPAALSAYRGALLNTNKLDKTGHNITSRVVITDSNGTITPYLDGPTVSQLYAMRDFDDSSTLKTQLDGKAPTNHQSTGTGYGVGTSAAYGHLKIANNLTTDSFDANAPVALSAYQGKVLSDGKAPTSHSSTASTYGLGNQSAYGHVKIIDALTSSAYAAGEALSAYQGKVLNDAKAPNDHASTGTTYGVGNKSYYGHVKLIDALTSSAYAAGEALSAYQGAVLKGLIDALTSCSALSSGGNLNNYTTAGTHYYAANATTAAGITNSPVTNSGYTLHVFPHGASGCYQQAEDNSGNVYARVLPNSGGTWTAWKTLS